MNASTERQQFRALVADVAARAKATLPLSVNGRVESAVKLVLAGDVFFCADGSVGVASSTDPLTVYHRHGTTCGCADFARVAGGWCKHRISAGILKRVGELLAPVPDPLDPWPDDDPVLEETP